MIKQHYAGASRRAVNIIWNAAGDYSFDPPFQAFFPNGEYDQYFNMVIGLVKKWLDLDRISAFFDSFGTSRGADEANAILWLGIENCVYEKELPERPVMEQLRRTRAEAFFRYKSTLSRQQMMLQSMKVFDQEEARWNSVLGKKLRTITPREKKLAEELEFPGSWDTDDVIRHMKDILGRYFRLKVSSSDAGRGFTVHGVMKSVASKLLKHEHRNTDILVLRRGSGTGDEKNAVHLAHNVGEIHTSKDPEKDRQYIEAVFGPCMYSEHEMRILENELCEGSDEGCRLWFTRSGEGMDTSTKEGRDLRADEERQKKRNENFMNDHRFQIQESIRNLTANTDTIFSSYLRFLPERAKRGRLDPSIAYRLPVLDDPNVFLADSDMAEYTVSVDLLLDASQSRMNSQEEIASQAYIIARSFESCHIPVRVTAFRSLRGYTVIQKLKDYGDMKCRGISSYYAGGWNRDSLCLKALEHVMEDEKHSSDSKRILLVLTDANPNDSVPMPPKEGGIMNREYEGPAAVEETEKAVRNLRNHGIKTAAIFLGAASHLENVHLIYGQEYVRIKRINQLADAVGSLLKMNLREMPIEQ